MRRKRDKEKEKKKNGCAPFWQSHLQHSTHYRNTLAVISWPCNLWIAGMQIGVTVAGPWLFLEDKTYLKWFWRFLLPLRYSKVRTHPTELYTPKHSNQYFPTFRLPLEKMEWDGYVQEAIQLTSDLNCHFKGLDLSLDRRLGKTILDSSAVCFA